MAGTGLFTPSPVTVLKQGVINCLEDIHFMFIPKDNRNVTASITVRYTSSNHVRLTNLCDTVNKYKSKIRS